MMRMGRWMCVVKRCVLSEKCLDLVLVLKIKYSKRDFAPGDRATTSFFDFVFRRVQHFGYCVVWCGKEEIN